MKTILTILVIATSLCCKAQIPRKDGKGFYELIDSSKFSKDQLFTKSKLWFTDNFLDSKAVLEIDDRITGELVGKGDFDRTHYDSTYKVSFDYTCFFTIKIDLKDKKYRLQIYAINILLQNTKDKMAVEDLRNGSSIENEINVAMQKIIILFKDAISTDDSF